MILQNINLIDRKATDTIYQLNVFIAVKRARLEENKKIDYANKQRKFKFFENYSLISYLIRCYYRISKNIFLELVSNENIAILLDQYQQRDCYNIQVLKITQALDLQNLYCWIKQLCLVAADLEQIELCYKNICSENIFLNTNRNLRLSNLDCRIKIEKNIVVLTELFEQLLNQKNNIDTDIYSKSDIRTEIFAIDSVYYILLCNYKSYKTESWNRDYFVILDEKFQKKKFLLLTDSAENTIIYKCWNGEY